MESTGEKEKVSWPENPGSYMYSMRCLLKKLHPLPQPKLMFVNNRRIFGSDNPHPEINRNAKRTIIALTTVQPLDTHVSVTI